MPKWYRLNSSGSWAPLKIYRLYTNGSWTQMKKIYRLYSDGFWRLVHTTAAVPSATTSPTLTNQNSSSTIFYGGDVLTLTRGAYTETTTDSDTSYRMRIYKGTDPNLALNGTNWTIVKEGNYTGANSTASTSISSLASDLTDSDAYNDYYYVGEVRVNNDANTVGSTNYDFETTPKVLSRISFTVSGFTPSSVTENDVFFQWTVGGISTSSYIYEQKLIIRQSGPNGTIVENISPSVSDRSYSLINSANLLPSTQYYATIEVTANDGWRISATPNKLTDSAYFTTTALPPVNTVAPTLKPLNNRSGVGLAGYVPYNTALTSSQGTWNNTSGTTTYEYDWTKDNGSVPTIYQNAGSTKIFSSSDLGNFLSVRVKATNADGGFGYGYSDAYEIMAPITITAFSTSANVNIAKTFTATISNYPARYTINWGDGTSSYDSGSITLNTSTINVSQSHTYTSTGDKTVTITAYYKNNESPVTSTITISVLNAAPTNTIAPTLSPTTNRTPLSGFTGYLPVSTTITANKGTWTSVDANTTYSYDWWLEDDVTGSVTSSGFIPNTTRSYSVTNVNDYVFVRVKATNLDGQLTIANSGSYILGQAIAVGNVTPTTATQNLSSNFTFSISNYPTSYTVDWGDGTSQYSSGSIAANTATVNPIISHIYTSSGTKTITVTAEPGGVTSTTNITVSAPNLTAPTITLVSPPSTPSGALTVYFSGGSGPYYQFWWQSSNNYASVTGYDANGSSSPLTDLSGPSAGTWYVAVRSVSALTNIGSGPSSTISSWSSPVQFTVSAGTPPSTPTNGGGTFSTGTNYVTNATFTRSTSGTTPITYNWTVYSSTSSSGPWSFRNSGSISSSTLGGTQSIPQQSWNQTTYGSWSQYNVYASNAAGSSGTLTWII